MVKKDLLAVFGEFINRTTQDAELAAAYHKGESLKVSRENGYHKLSVSDSKGLIATLDYRDAEDSMEAFRRAFPLLGTLHMLREHGLVFPDSLNN